MLWPYIYGTFYGHMVYFVTMCYILWLFGIFFLVLVCCSTKNLATLHPDSFLAKLLAWPSKKRFKRFKTRPNPTIATYNSTAVKKAKRVLVQKINPTFQKTP
jgi:hypothetical protein